MSLSKRLGRSAFVRRLAGALIATYIRLVHATSRWTVENDAEPQRLWREGKPFILAFWHGRILMMPYSWRAGVPMNMLISKHPDGDIIANAIGHFGLKTVRGSAAKPTAEDKQKGGAQALMAMMRLIRAGESVGITPDGPRGPRMRASDGVVALARLSGLPVIPCAFATSRRRIAASWDRFVIALPFSRGAFVWGDPITVARDADGPALDAARRAIEDGLNAATARADMLVGAAPIAPAAEVPA